MTAKTTKPGRGFKRPLSVQGRARGLIEHARRLQAARAVLAESLPEELQNGWQLARLDADALVLVTDTAGRAMRLRYARSLLLQAAQRHAGTQPQTLIVKRQQPTIAPRAEQPARLTPAAAASLRQAADGMEDERLRKALIRLARRAGRTG